MRKLFAPGRRRYLVLFALIAGAVVIMGNSCEPTKEPPPERTGLTIEPATHDFGNQFVGGGFGIPQTFTVTNNGPNTTGSLAVTLQAGDTSSFMTSADTCSGNLIAAGDTCTVDAAFGPQTPGAVSTDLVVSDPADGQAVALLSGNGIL